MEHVIMPLFSIPLYVSNIDITKEMKEITKSIEYKRINVDNGDLSINPRILDDPIFNKIKIEILKHIDCFINETLKVSTHITFNIQNSWVMRHKKNDYSQPHIHINSLLSGILYIDVDDKSGDLVFQKENNYPNLFPPAINVPVKERNIFNSKSWSFTPTVGQIFIFPSTLSHSVNNSMSDNFRYCIAFNLFPTGSFGIEEPEPLSILNLK